MADGSGPKRAVLYARVSTTEQAEHGYSLAQQLEALREWASREGHEVLEEVEDKGHSGSTLERPGLDRVRDLVADGGVSVVMAQDRDRFAREPAYHYLLKREFEESGTRIRSLNDRGDESPEGELTDGILDQLSKYERAKITERTRRGKVRKVREGKIMPGRYPRYGFTLNASGDGYELDPERMALVRRIFSMVGEEGMTIRGVATTLDAEGVPTPSGGKFWDRGTLRYWILDDSYLPHTYEEVKAVASPEAVAGLDPDKCYGILWWGRRATTTRQTSEPTPDGGRRYRKTHSYRQRDRSEQIPVPVPDSGIEPELIHKARAQIEGNRVTSAAGGRFWELTGGIAYCGECGRRMQGRAKYRKHKTKPGEYYTYLLYRCGGNETHSHRVCHNSTSLHAGPLESRVWDEVSAYLSEPERLRADLERMIEMEKEGRHGDPEKEAAYWSDRIAEAEHRRAAFQDQQAEGLITMDELKSKLASLEEGRDHARRELEEARSRRDRLADMERDAQAILDYYAEITPEALDSLEPEEHHHIYRLLGVRVYVYASRDVSVEIPLTAGEGSVSDENTRRSALTEGPS